MLQKIKQKAKNDSKTLRRVLHILKGTRKKLQEIDGDLSEEEHERRLIQICHESQARLDHIQKYTDGFVYVAISFLRKLFLDISADEIDELPEL
mgnify:CR=1 FL=1